MLGRGEMHRPALAAHETVVALHQLAQHLLYGHAARERVSVAAIGAEGKVTRLHGGGKARRNRLLTERKMAGAFDEILQKEIEGALLALADLDLHAIQGEPRLLADIVVDSGTGCVGLEG